MRSSSPTVGLHWVNPPSSNFDAWHLDIDEEHRRSLELAESAIAIYDDPRFLPEGMKAKHRCNNIFARAIRSSDRLGTIMASYSQQHLLGTHLAETQGIFAVLVFEAKLMVSLTFSHPIRF